MDWEDELVDEMDELMDEFTEKVKMIEEKYEVSIFLQYEYDVENMVWEYDTP